MNAQIGQCIDNWGNILMELDFSCAAVLNEAKLPAAQVGVNGAAAAHAADDRNPQSVQRRNGNLPADVLVLSNNDSRVILPKEKQIFIPIGLKDIFL